MDGSIVDISKKYNSYNLKQHEKVEKLKKFSQRNNLRKNQRMF